MANEDETRCCMDGLSKLGRTLSLDDFGTTILFRPYSRPANHLAKKLIRALSKMPSTKGRDAVIVKAIIN